MLPLTTGLYCSRVPQLTHIWSKWVGEPDYYIADVHLLLLPLLLLLKHSAAVRLPVARVEEVLLRPPDWTSNLLTSSLLLSNLLTSILLTFILPNSNLLTSILSCSPTQLPSASRHCVRSLLQNLFLRLCSCCSRSSWCCSRSSWCCSRSSWCCSWSTTIPSLPLLPPPSLLLLIAGTSCKRTTILLIISVPDICQFW